MVGAQRRLDQVEVAADDRVVVDVGNVFQRILDLRLEVFRRDLALLAGGGIEPRDEEAVQPARDVGIAVEHGGDETLALRDAGLLQIAAIGAQDADRRGAEPGRLGERVVAVIVGLAPPDRQEHFLEQLAAVGEIDRLLEGVLEFHVVDEDRAVRTASPPRRCAR